MISKMTQKGVIFDLFDSLLQRSFGKQRTVIYFSCPQLSIDTIYEITVFSSGILEMFLKIICWN